MSGKNRHNKGNNQSQNNQPLTFDQKKALWVTQGFVNKLFGFKKDSDSLKYGIVENYISEINKLEDREVYYMAGYGSLINDVDVPRTLPNLVSHTPAFIAGWERVFNMGNSDTGSYLNVRETEGDKRMLVALLEIPINDMPGVIAREANYSFVPVTTYPVLEGTPDEIEALMVVGNYESEIALDPQLNYLHLCMSGASKLLGYEGVQNFMDTTFTYRGDLNEWFKNVNLKELMWKHNYLKR